MLSTSLKLSQFSHFTTWLDSTPLGAYMLQEEWKWFDTVSLDIFGYKAMQLQLPHINFLRENRIPWHFRAAQETGGDLQCYVHKLPIASQSLDLLVLPHVLDFANYPQEVLREAQRVLMPEGRLLITGFNPWSLWAYRRWGKCDGWAGNWLALPRLKDWLSLLGFESMQGNYVGYTFPLQNVKWLEYFRWMEKAGDRWWPAAGSVYCLDMIKRVHGMKMIMPRWKNSISAAAPVTIADASYKMDKSGLHE